MGPSSAGAVGWMQFMPSTWLRWGVDADGDGIADPWNATDAVYAAARYLAASGGQTDIARAIFSYNHADWYVREVLDLAQRVRQRDGRADRRPRAAAGRARQGSRARSSRRTRSSSQRRSDERSLRIVSSTAACEGRPRRRCSPTGSPRERDAVQFDVRLDGARDAVARAQDARRRARRRALHERAAERAGAVVHAGGRRAARRSVVRRPWVFPVGGGPEVVSVAHTHHDYPAADIAAPAGSPVYALSNAVVLNAWHEADPRCGIGLTIRDRRRPGLDVLPPRGPRSDRRRTASRSRPARRSGSSARPGHATGPHLHLQLQPATTYPQYQPWFQSFAGKAFRWQDAPTLTRTAGRAAGAEGLHGRP